MDQIRVLFVLPNDCTDESDASDLMVQTYQSCKHNVVNVSWVKESDFDTIDFSKTDFVVFEEFTGKNFESLKESKCARILGPWCLLVCLMDGHPIPNFTWPIYNVAMSGVIVTSSHILKAKKAEIKEKVQLMGGCYTDTFMSTNTHLITESAKSEKYLLAAERGLKLFVSNWVDAVWEASQTNKIHCDDEQFNKYKCPPFHNLTISCTGFTSLERRSQVAQTVAKHGGVFTANLAVSTTDVLIVNGESGMLSKKYTAAKSTPNIFCVTENWIEDSIKKGYALPHNLYTVKKKGTSTPTKPDETGPNFSMISAIGDVTQRLPQTLEETALSPLKRLQPCTLFPSKISPNKRKCTNEELDKLVDGLDVKRAKKAGQYLDGCSVFLAGFKPEQREKLAKILNLSGATRYDDISDRLTHIIVGDTTCPEVKIIKSKNYSVSLVTIHWLLDSMEEEKIADEENYLMNLNDSDKEQFSSPLGKKGLSLLRSRKTMTSNDYVAASTTKKIPEPPEDDLIEQYRRPLSVDDSDTLVRLLRENGDFNSRADGSRESKKPDTSNEKSENTLQNDPSQESNVFYAKNFVIVNFSPEDCEHLREQIEGVLGTVMSKAYKGIPDYVVAPTTVKSPIQISALEVVNTLWIAESIHENEEVVIEYYHRPLVVPECKPLENCVVAISGYASFERSFLRDLIEALGGISQEQFARVVCVKKNVQASTHLVSLEAEGKKYNAALKWGLPVVSKEWLLECAKVGKCVPEEGFLRGAAKARVRSISENSSASASTSSKTTPKLTPSRNSISSNMNSFRKILTPVSQRQPLDISTTEKTPINQNTPVNQKFVAGAGETPFSQITPINKLMEEVRKTNLLGTPQTPPMRKTWHDVDTPESPFGAFIRPHLSPKSKKEILRYINCIPDFVPPKERRKSTPLSEVKRRCWAKLLGTQDSPSRFPANKTEAAATSYSTFGLNDKDDDGENVMEIDNDDENNAADSQTNDNDVFVDTKLKEIEAMVNALSEKRKSRAFEQPAASSTSEEVKLPIKDSQVFTVGWDYDEHVQSLPKQQQCRLFIISGVENEQRQQLIEKIEQLGGQVSELSSYDPKCTHLVCLKPARNEKTLSCMASGKWILHTSYVEKSTTAGKFLPEEDFEFGNPKSKENIATSFDKANELKTQSIHWWRKEIARRGYGAFNDMRAIVVAQKPDPIIRVIEAGGGQVVDAMPPFTEAVHATHCLLEVRSVDDFNVYTPLAQQGILCINTLYISDFLYRTNKDIKDAVIPHLLSFYS